MPTEQKFWLVWNRSNAIVPWMPHLTKTAAIKEAERLAAENTNDKFYVMEAVSITSYVKITTKEIN